MKKPGPCVYFVDDDEDDRLIIEEAVRSKQLQYFVGLFASGNDLLLHLNSMNSLEYPDLFVLDYNMPLERGDQLLMKLKQDPRYLHIPVVIFSTSCSEKMESEVKRYGAIACIQKQAYFNKFMDQMHHLGNLASTKMVS